jgi:hypothetical protein
MGNFVIKSVSLPLEMAQFLDKNSELSLSKIIQSKIKEIIENRTTYENRMKVLENRLTIVCQKLYDANEEKVRLKATK